MDFKPDDAFTSEGSTTAFEKLSPPLLLEEEYEPFDSPFDEEISVPQTELSNEISNTEDSTTYILCELCNVNTISIERVRKKRKHFDEEIPILSTSKICDTCSNMKSIDLSKIKGGRKQGKTVVKRQRAKKRTVEKGMSESLKKLIEEQQAFLEENKNLPPDEFKKLRQVVRNRISAQQSRDRKKQYISEIDERNNALIEENDHLKSKLSTVQQENEYLKEQLSKLRYGTTTGASGSSQATMGIMAMLGVLCVVAVVTYPGYDNTLPEINTSIKLTEPLIEEIQVSDEFINYNITQYLQPVSDYTMEDYFEPVRSAALQRISEIDTRQNQFLPDTLDPCVKHVAQELANGRTDFSTIYCPDVKMYWKNNEQGIQLLQLIVPIDTDIPIAKGFPMESVKDDYLLELICKVVDMKLIPKTDSTLPMLYTNENS